MIQFFKNIPDDLALNIFSNLSHNDLARVARVDQRFNRLTKNPILKLARYKASWAHNYMFKLGDLDLVFRFKDRFPEREELKNKFFDFTVEVFSKSENYLKLFKHYIIRRSEDDKPIHFKPNANYYIRSRNTLINRDYTQLVGYCKIRKAPNISQEKLALFDQELKLASLTTNMPRILTPHEVKSIRNIFGGSSKPYLVARLNFQCAEKKSYKRLLEAARNHPLDLSKILRECQCTGLAKVINTEYKLQRDESKSIPCGIL